ncbi:MAG TPA: glycosyltransferase [Flavipsychrobacter sp.]|nr:glycosyltransferase [Flavipsychrobacter sp.]
MAYTLFFFVQLFSLPDEDDTSITDPQPVTIIICAKNEADNLRNNLPAIMAQRYSNASGISMYRVIVVNDASDDDTAGVLEGFKAVYDNLSIIHISPQEIRTLPGKKYALSKALATTETEYLLLTDADCTPASDSWLMQMVAPLHKGKELVAGFGAYIANNSMLNAFIRWETLHTFIQYAGYTLSGRPYMAVGRNLACTKAALLKAQQSANWAQLPSGDDDLLVNAVADGRNMAIVVTPSSITTSQAKATWEDWLLQKQRHVSTGKYYKTTTKLLLGLYALTHSLVWLSFLMLLLTSMWQLALGVMSVRLVINIIIQQRASRLTGQQHNIFLFILADIGWMIYNFVLSPYILLKNKQRWT